MAKQKEEPINNLTIPAVFKVGDVEINKETLLAKRTEDVKLVVAGIEDRDGYKKATELRAIYRTTRTTLEKFRKEVSAPHQAFVKKLKETTDELGAIAYEGELYFDQQIQAIDEEKERLKQLAIMEEARRVQGRVNELVKLGATFDGENYTFPYDVDYSIGATDVKEAADDTFINFVEEVTTSYNVHLLRLENERIALEKEREQERIDREEMEIEQAAIAQRNLEQAQVLADKEKAQKERETTIRVKELKLLGYEVLRSVNGDGYFSLEHPFNPKVVGKHHVEEFNDEQWAALVTEIENYVPPVPVVEEQPSPESFTPFGNTYAEMAETAVGSNEVLGDSVEELSQLQALAQRLDKTDIRSEFPSTDLVKYLRENNFVLVYGHSDDLVEMDGSIVDEADKYKGGQLHFNEKGWCSKAKSKGSIKAVFGSEKYCWSFVTDVPHVSFEMIDSEDELFINEAIIFDLNILTKPVETVEAGDDFVSPYQPLFNLMAEHGLTLLEGEMYEIMQTVREMDNVPNVVKLTFDADNPFEDFEISPKLLMRIYPEPYTNQTLEGIGTIAKSGQVQSLLWLIVSKEVVAAHDKIVAERDTYVPPTPKAMELADMVYIASKYAAKGYSYDQLRDGDDLYHLDGNPEREQVIDEIIDLMKEYTSGGSIAFREKYKHFNVY